ncbi:MAG: protein kinase [Blastocatellia bacterium]|nr:protein kinase [Blastocatellia bacterium]
MTPERWQRIERIYHAANEREGAERRAFVEMACGGDPELRVDVETLLAANERVGGFSTVTAEAHRKTASVSAPSLVGQEISHYRILSLLGTGGMGEVWMAEDRHLGRKVALKMLSERSIRDPKRVRRFEQEARAASALNHPNIVTIHELGATEAARFIVMEMIGGCTLRELIGQTLAPDALAGLGAQIARALSLAHGAGIVHRDIKPENIMVRDDGLVKVLDFGIARLNSELDDPAVDPADRTMTGMLLGTLQYMSPEQVRGEAVTDATDLFSLGVLLYELATQQHPFQPPGAPSGRAGQDSLMQAILTSDPVSPGRLNPDMPASLDLLLLQMLEKDPALRPTALEVEAALAEIERRINHEAGRETGKLRDRRTGGYGEDTANERAANEARPPRSVSQAHRRVTVGRDRERTELLEAFDEVVAGRGLVMCVAGEPGIGKTTIVEEFLKGLIDEERACHIVRGRCSERLAGAEAYLPWLEALDQLIRASDHAARAMKSLAPSWYAQLAPVTFDSLDAHRQMPDALAVSQERMKRELVGFLAEVSRLQPLVLYIDDLHWADVSTVDLLAFLAARFDGVRLLLLVTYRPSDMMLAKHPFLQIKPDLQARGVCRELPLAFLTQVEIENYLEFEFPLHRFPPEFPRLVHAKTEGSPLFMADLIRYLRDREVIAEVDGEWRLVHSVPEIERELPESVRGMIERKIAQLTDDERQLLVAAGVQGAQFDSSVVAAVLGADPSEIEERLEALERVYAFVQLIGERTLPDRTLTLRYRFVHVFYQNTLYASLRPTRRVQLSHAVAEALLAAYGDRSREAASELAALFEAAREYARAAEYCRLAAENAVHLFASREAAAHARRGLAALESLPESEERLRLEFSLQIVLGNILIATHGYASPDVEAAYQRARRLCELLGDTTNLLPVLYGLYVNHLARANYREAMANGEEFTAHAARMADPAVIVGHRTVAVPLFFLGELADARRRLEQGLAIYDGAKHRPLTWMYGGEPAMVCRNYLAWTCWLQGYPDQSLAHSREAVRLSREVRHAQSQAQALAGSALLHQYRREPQPARELAEAAITLASEQGLALWLGWGTILRGWAMLEQGQTADGLERIRRGIDGSRQTGSGMWQTYLLCLLADASARAGKIDDGLALLARIPALIESSRERFWEAEIHRVRGELLRQAGADAREYETCFRLALDLAREQGARSLELRAALSLAKARGGSGDALAALDEIYRWFTEGLDTPDLLEARALLDAGR